MTGLVLLTGATGFVGGQVLHYLLERGVSVRAVVRDVRAKELETLYSFESVLATSDIFNEKAEWWAMACKDVDTVIHVAWYAEPGKYLDSSKNIDCLSGTLMLAKGAVEAGVRRFIGVGSCFEYDLSVGDLTIGTALKPLTPYAAAKAAAYMTLSTWLQSMGLEFAWCRLFYLYGDGEDRRRLVPYLHAQLAAGETADLSSGNQIRDYLDVRTAGRMIVDIAMGTMQGAINICSGIPITVRELAESIADEYGRRDLLHFGARPDNLIDPPRILGIK